MAYCQKLQHLEVVPETEQADYLDTANKVLMSTEGKQLDASSQMEAAETLAVQAQKDMNWKKVLNSPQRELALEALHKEITSLCSTILTEITPDDGAEGRGSRR